MKNIFILSILLLTSSILFAQFHFTVYSTPDSAAVYMNDEIVDYTPCKIVYRWSDAIDKKLVFSVKSDGYNDWSDTLYSKPLSFDRYENLALKKKFPIYEMDASSPTINFDRLIVEFKDGKVVGKKTDRKGISEQFRWTGSIKVGDKIYENKFYQYLTDMGYNSPISDHAKLFSDDNRRKPKLPRYSVGVEITDYYLNYTQHAKSKTIDGDAIARTRIEYNWQVLDKTNGKVILNYKNVGIAKSRQYFYQRVENNIHSYELALIDFLSSNEFHTLITETEGTDPVYAITDSDSTGENEVMMPNLPAFDKISEMIQFANKACVTIITDGGHGSGVIIDKSGLVLSAYHVVDGVNQIDVKFSTGLTLRAEIVDFDKFNDIVLLDITGEGFPALPMLSNKNEVQLGEEVLTIGTPAELELGQSISKGILSGKRKIEDRIYLQADIAVSPGNSGGPLLNSKGEVVGVVQRKIVGEGIEGIGFAIPIKKVKELLGIIEN